MERYGNFAEKLKNTHREIGGKTEEKTEIGAV